MSCPVCIDGDYLIMDRHGSEWGYISCPACHGSGLSDEEADLEARKRRDRARYDAAMNAMRLAPKAGAGMEEGR